MVKESTIHVNLVSPSNSQPPLDDSFNTAINPFPLPEVLHQTHPAAAQPMLQRRSMDDVYKLMVAPVDHYYRFSH